MKLNKLIILCCMILPVMPVSAQIHFFGGSYAEALQQARKEKKALFVDFWAEWCGPCKMMAADVFTDKEVGEYFNEHFVCLQVDADNKANHELVKRFQVKALPSLLFIGSDDKEIRRTTGAQSAGSFLHEAKIALGEELSYEQLYEKYKKDKQDFLTQQGLLIGAQGFMMNLENYERGKWAVRIENLYKEYMKNKKLENMINPEDFYILSLYHREMTKNDPVFDFIVANYGKFMQAVDTNIVADYIMGMNNSYMMDLCRKGDLSYKEGLKRMSEGDLKPLYAPYKYGKLSAEEAMTLMFDAVYYLYRHNLPKFFDNMDKYLAGKGANVTLSDYTQALEGLAIAYEGKLPEEVYPHCIGWIGKALDFKESNTPVLHSRLLVMLGQCFQHTGDHVKAKQSYNQAFIESAQIEQPGQRQQIQRAVQQGLRELDQ